MDENQLAGGAPSDVLVTEGVAANLHVHLARQSRNIGAPQDVALLLHKAVERAWGTNSAPRFNDDAGGGWTVDLSGWLDGEMLYAQIRTVHGRRTLTTVIEADEYEQFVQTGKWQSPAAINPEAALVDPEALKEAEAIEQKRALPSAARPGAPAPARAPEDPDEPILLLINYRSGDVPTGAATILRCKRSEVPEKIRGLLQQEKVTENDIEIWSRMTKPKVTIQF